VQLPETKEPEQSAPVSNVIADTSGAPSKASTDDQQLEKEKKVDDEQSKEGSDAQSVDNSAPVEQMEISPVKQPIVEEEVVVAKVQQDDTEAAPMDTSTKVLPVSEQTVEVAESVVVQPEISTSTVVQPEISLFIQPEVDTVVQPKVNTVVQPEVDTVVQPEADVVQLEVDVVNQPEIKNENIVIEPEIKSNATIVQPKTSAMAQPKIKAVSQQSFTPPSKEALFQQHLAPSQILQQQTREIKQEKKHEEVILFDFCLLF